MASTRRDRRDLDLETKSPAGTCALCTDHDPQSRSRHQLELARHGGLDGLRHHLHAQLVQRRPAATGRPDVVDDILTWVGTLMTQYSGLAHPVTGAPLAWWEARQYLVAQTDAIAQAAWRRAPEGAQGQPGPLAPWIRATIQQYGQARPLREPGDERLEDI